MPLDAAQLKDALAALRNARAREQPRLNRIHRALCDSVTGSAAGVYVPRRATREYRMLVEQSRFNVLDLVVTAVAQNLYVDGFRPTRDGRVPSRANAKIWDTVWQPNRMDARQAALYRGAISYGVSYALVLPGDPVPVITPMSARRMTALYADPANDEWPELAMEVERERYTGDVERRRVLTVRIFDDQAVYKLDVTDRGEPDPRLLSVQEHGLGETPVVRFKDRYDLDVPLGKVEPLIPIQQQINQTTFNLAMALQYAAFRQRWVTGMQIETDEAGNPRAPFNIAVDQMLQAESTDTKFGEYGQTDVKGYLEARDKQLLHVASVAQIPPHNLLVGAGISNISAEALAALEAGHRQDITEHQISFGESVEQMLRLAGLAMSDRDTWEDMSAQVVWRDTTPRSIAQVADAFGKLAQMLAVPPRALWERIPGVTDQDITRWEQLADREDGLDMAELEQTETTPSGNGRRPALTATPT